MILSLVHEISTMPPLTGTVSPTSVVIAGSLNATGLTLLNCPSITVAGDFVTNTITSLPGSSVINPQFDTLNSGTVTAAIVNATTINLGSSFIGVQDDGTTLSFGVSTAAAATAKCLWYTAPQSSDPTLKLDAYGNLTATGTILATSDGRVKSAVRTIPRALERVMALRGVTFARDDPGAEPGRRHVGFIAQEVDAVLPEAVYEDTESGRKSVAYGNMVALLVEAMHELVDEMRSTSSSSCSTDGHAAVPK